MSALSAATSKGMVGFLYCTQAQYSIAILHTPLGSEWIGTRIPAPHLNRQCPTHTLVEWTLKEITKCAPLSNNCFVDSLPAKKAKSQLVQTALISDTCHNTPPPDTTILTSYQGSPTKQFKGFDSFCGVLTQHFL